MGKWLDAMFSWKRFCMVGACASIAWVALAMVAVNAQAQSKPDLPTGAHVSVASLPMYEVSDAMKKADDIFWNRLSAKLRSQGIDAPLALERTTGELVDQWEGGHLLLSQACGFPYVHILMERDVKIVGTPVYTTNDGLPPGEYRSVVIVKARSPYQSLADLKGKRAGVNDMGSNSGMNAFRAAVASSFSADELKHGVFASVTTTGGHLRSVRMVASGQIDVAAIDSVSYDLIKRDYPELAAETRVLMTTAPSPGLPMITSAQTDDATIEKMRASIKDLVMHPGDAELRWALGEMKLESFVVIDKNAYRQRINQLEEMARNKGYPVLQ